jgi:hypothetical protein
VKTDALTFSTCAGSLWLHIAHGPAGLPLHLEITGEALAGLVVAAQRAQTAASEAALARSAAAWTEHKDARDRLIAETGFVPGMSRSERKARGICVACPAKARSGRTLCLECARKQLVGTKAWHERQAANDARKAAQNG